MEGDEAARGRMEGGGAPGEDGGGEGIPVLLPTRPAKPPINITQGLN